MLGGQARIQTERRNVEGSFAAPDQCRGKLATVTAGRRQPGLSLLVDATLQRNDQSLHRLTPHVLQLRGSVPAFGHGFQHGAMAGPNTCPRKQTLMQAGSGIIAAGEPRMHRREVLIDNTSQQRRDDGLFRLEVEVEARARNTRDLQDPVHPNVVQRLAVAGNDTTRNTITFSALALQQFPEQRAVLASDFDATIDVAVEEFLRWATPVMTFRRTATRDTELGGQQITAGDWLLLIYSSGNRDERAFDDPHVFDVRRTPNPHMAFGGGGPHFCMGAFLARMQLKSIFRELIVRAPGLRLGEPSYLAGNFVRAVKSLPYSLG